MNDYGHQNESPLPRSRDEDDAEEERECRDDGKSHRLQMSLAGDVADVADMSPMLPKANATADYGQQNGGMSQSDTCPHHGSGGSMQYLRSKYVIPT